MRFQQSVGRSVAANGLAALGAHCLPTLACFSETPMGERARWHVVLPSEWHARDIKIIAVSVAEFFFSSLACCLLTKHVYVFCMLLWKHVTVKKSEKC